MLQEQCKTRIYSTPSLSVTVIVRIRIPCLRPRCYRRHRHRRTAHPTTPNPPRDCRPCPWTAPPRVQCHGRWQSKSCRLQYAQYPTHGSIMVSTLMSEAEVPFCGMIFKWYTQALCFSFSKLHVLEITSLIVAKAKIGSVLIPTAHRELAYAVLHQHPFMCRNEPCTNHTDPWLNSDRCALHADKD